MPKKSYNQWKVCRFKSRLGEKEGMVLLSFWMVGKEGSYLVLYTTLIGKPLPLLTSGRSTTLSRTFLVLFLSTITFSVILFSLARNTEWLLLSICRCHYFVEQWAISLRCIILIRSWVSKAFAMSGILITHKLTDLNFLYLSYR